MIKYINSQKEGKFERQPPLPCMGSVTLLGQMFKSIARKEKILILIIMCCVIQVYLPLTSVTLKRPKICT